MDLFIGQLRTLQPAPPRARTKRGIGKRRGKEQQKPQPNLISKVAHLVFPGFYWFESSQLFQLTLKGKRLHKNMDNTGSHHKGFLSQAVTTRGRRSLVTTK